MTINTFSTVLLGILLNASILIPKNAILGQSSILSCEVHTSLPIDTTLLSVWWMHKESGLNHTGLLTHKYSFVYVTNFTLNETTVEHSGLYSCHVLLYNNRQLLTAKGNLTVSCE